MNKVNDFCIDNVKRLNGAYRTWSEAMGDSGCSGSGFHLCSGGEWIAGCRAAAGFSNNLPSGWSGPDGEWAGDIVANNVAMRYGVGSCYVAGTESIYSTRPYRCCKNLI